MGRCPVRLHQLPAIGPGTSDTAARPGRSVAAGNILDVGQASSLGAWRVLHGHLPGKPDARPSARSASGCTIPHHDSTPDQPAGRTPCASPTAGKFTEAIAGSAAKSQRGGHFGLCRRPIRSGPLHGVRDRHHAPITSICAAIPFNRWPLRAAALTAKTPRFGLQITKASLRLSALRLGDAPWLAGWRATIICGLEGECSLPGQRVRIGHCRRVRVRQARGAGDGAAATARRSGAAGVP
jgi:hypothetical protein